MITSYVRGDVLKSDCKHIIFAINAEGYNDAGFAGLVARRYWPKLANTGPCQLGAVLVNWQCTEDYTFYAIVCHTLTQNGWEGSPDIIQKALDDIAQSSILDPSEKIGIVAIGDGPVGRLTGAPTEQIRQAVHASQLKVTVYSL